jgi:hypothetical protein
MPVQRAWDYWVRHVERAGLMPAKVKAKRSAARSKPAKRTAAETKRVSRKPARRR